MTPPSRLAALLALGCLPILSGCVAALVPVLAAGALGRSAVSGPLDGSDAAPAPSDEERARRSPVLEQSARAGPTRTVPPARAGGAVESREAVVLATDRLPDPRGGDSFDAGGAAEDLVARSPAGPSTYGTVEVAAVLSVDRLPEPGAVRADGGAAPTSWTLMADYVRAQMEARAAGRVVRSAVLERGVRLAQPRFASCDDHPLAALIDLDAEGADLRRPLDPASVTVATAEAAVGLHSAGVRLLWVSDRPVSQADELRQALARTGLFAEGDRLLLADGTRKQERRWAAARSNCVVALMGDRRGDMDELFDYLRKPEAAHMLEGLWNAGWFLAPPPITTIKD